MRRTAPALLALGLVPALLGTVPAASAGSNAEDDRAPQWRSDLPATAIAPDVRWRYRSVLDPASGDLLTYYRGAAEDTAPAPFRVRRTDGETGETLWEVGLGPAGILSATELTLDPGGDRVLVAQSGSRGPRLTSIGLDGVIDWRVRTRADGDVQALETNPVTGTTCFTSTRWDDGYGRRPPNTWLLTCHDREGRRVGGGRVRQVGATYGPTALAVNPDLGTWYVAGAHRHRGGARTLVAAFREGGPRLWTAHRDRARGDADVWSIAVDEANGVVHVGGGSEAGATLLSWSADGRPRGDRTWRSAVAVDDLAVDVPRRRLVAVVRTRQARTFVRVMRSLGRTVRYFEHVDRGGQAEVALDPERRHLFVSGARTAAYRWNGKRLWLGTERLYSTDDLLVDAERDRVLVQGTGRAAPVGLRLTAYDR